MPIKTQAVSGQRKTGNMPQTYRSGGEKNKFGTCPSSCLFIEEGHGTDSIDQDYAHALARAVPKGGQAFTYSHFHWALWNDIGFNKPGRTTMNYSASNINQAFDALYNGIPTVMMEFDPPKVERVKMRMRDGRFLSFRKVACPMERENSKVKCITCGGKDGPLCARADRDYIIVFKRKKWKKIICYAANGYVRRIWEGITENVTKLTDGKELLAWIRALPYGSIVRHHVAGDIGKIK
jgi:hypothetical protein|tara:strand:- start:86 stop:796 length:711 start_codon:yes stop_codon:yes gene_type:complete